MRSVVDAPAHAPPNHEASRRHGPAATGVGPVSIVGSGSDRGAKPSVPQRAHVTMWRWTESPVPKYGLGARRAVSPQPVQRVDLSVVVLSVSIVASCRLSSMRTSWFGGPPHFGARGYDRADRTASTRSVTSTSPSTTTATTMYSTGSASSPAPSSTIAPIRAPPPIPALNPVV